MRNLIFAFMMAGSAFVVGCGGGGGGGDGGSKTCTEMHSCVNGACMCTAGDNKDKSCCDPNDTSCAGTSNACDQFCKQCQ